MYASTESLLPDAGLDVKSPTVQGCIFLITWHFNLRTIHIHTHNSGQRHQNLGGQGDQTFAHNTVTCMREEGREGGLGKILRSLRLVMRLWLLMSFCCDTQHLVRMQRWSVGIQFWSEEWLD